MRKPEQWADSGDDVLVWVKADDGEFYVILDSGVMKKASLVTYEGMTMDWEPSAECFLELEGAK